MRGDIWIQKLIFDFGAQRKRYSWTMVEIKQRRQWLSAYRIVVAVGFGLIRCIEYLYADRIDSMKRFGMDRNREQPLFGAKSAVDFHQKYQIPKLEAFFENFI